MELHSGNFHIVISILENIMEDMMCLTFDNNTCQIICDYYFSSDSEIFVFTFKSIV